MAEWTQLSSMARFSARKFAGVVSLANMPPTRPAAMVTTSGLGLILTRQIELAALRDKHVASFLSKTAHSCGTSHASMARPQKTHFPASHLERKFATL
jgi:hypothetical protein